MAKTATKVNYGKWSVIVTLIIGIPGAIAGYLTFPQVGCEIGLNTSACAVPQKDVEFVTQAESGELLQGVAVNVIANKGAPEVQYSDAHGYVKVNIPSKGNVRIILSKQGYPTQDFSLNLENNQDTIRTIKFSTSGEPSVQPVASLPPTSSPTVSPSSTSSPSPTSSPSSTNSPSPNGLILPGNFVKVDGSVTWELKKCARKQTDVSCSFALTTSAERENYTLQLDSSTKMTDHFGHEYFVSNAIFVDNKAGKNNSLSHEMQNGSVYLTSIDFEKIPISVIEVNSLIIRAIDNRIGGYGNEIKFDKVSIEGSDKK